MANRNPTRTLGIERRWHREINRRWAEYRTRVTTRLRADQAMLTNAASVFTMSAERQRVYMRFVEDEIQRLLLATEQAPNWQAQYQLESYTRGLERTRAALVAQGADLVPTVGEQLTAAGLRPFTATPSLGGGSTAAPIHQDALEFLYTRSYESLGNWTDKLATETRQILFDGVTEGQGIDEVVRRMVDRIDVSRSRARVIAQTETVQAYQRSNGAEATRASEEIGKPVLLRWLTVMDSRVRHLHAQYHGTLSTPEEYARKIGVSPWNCRCASAPVIPRADTAKKRAKFTEERRLMMLVERK